MADPIDPLDPAQEELTDDELDALDPEDEIGGDAAAHPAFTFPSVLVGPATSDQFNTIEEWIRPVACWRLDDTRFQFDSSFVKPGAARELRLLAETRDDHPAATLSLFGHADPVGDDLYNKVLSGRRARAVYAMLVRKPEIWEELKKGDKRCPGDQWADASLETMLTTVGRDSTEAKKLDEDGRKALYLQYMNKLCGPKLLLDPTKDFLARGGDADLRGDVQGCSEFNAVRRFSAKENSTFSQTSKKTERDTENLPNRRVVGFLFAPNLIVKPAKWPCPAALKGPEKCRDRFFVDHSKRRANQANRREFATDKNTFECRFYHRLAVQSPCETSTLTVLQRIRVRLRLVYLDPMGKERPFPKGVRVTALSPDGTSRRARVGDDGRTRFVIDRPRLSFSLQFDSSDKLYYASAGPGSTATPTDKLVGEDDVDDAIKQGFRLFKVPHQWSTVTSDWPKVESPLFADGSFSGIENLDTGIGSKDNPVKMVLDPHWQYLRWVYFDRVAAKQLPCPPMIVEGFELASLALGEEDTRSNWTTDEKKNQCLPWIRRDRNRPDADVLVQLNARGKRRFVETGTNRVLTVDEGGGPDTIKKSTVDTPSVQRLNFYDLPRIWKSRGYFAKLGSAGDAFEKLADKATSDAQPLTFSLDDMVLVDSSLTPDDWDPSTQRVAIFSNKIHKGIAAGLFRPDTSLPTVLADGSLSRPQPVSQIPALVTDRNYLADYPDWTRVIFMGGEIYDVFDRRLPNSKDDIVGARAAVRWSDDQISGGPGARSGKGGTTAPDVADRTVSAVLVNFHITHTPGQGESGRMDQALLRCCDVESGVEIGVNIHYIRLNFNFTPTDKNNATRPQNTITAAGQPKWINDGLVSLVQRWNGPDGDANKGGVQLVPAAGGPLRIPVFWFAQAIPKPNAEAQYRVDVWKDGRSFMSDFDGLGELKQTGNQPTSPAGPFTMAHESGHGDSLPDEYVENTYDCSYKQPGYREYVPGGPYRDDQLAIMRGNVEVRNRHFWPSAEWARTLDNTTYAIKYDGFSYTLPPHPKYPGEKKTWATLPFVEKLDVRSGAGGFYSCWLYLLGPEKYSVTNKGTFDGILCISLRMKLTFQDKNGNAESNQVTLSNSVSHIFSAVKDQLNDKFFVTGDANGMHFKKARLYFLPRVLVTNDSGDPTDKYHQGLDNPNNKTYAQLVTDVETNNGPTHFNVNVKPGGPSVVFPNPTGAGITDFGKEITEEFPRFFVGMLGLPVTAGALAQASNYDAIAQQVMPNGKVHSLP